MDNQDQADLDNVKQRLEQMLAEAGERLEHIEADLSETPSPDSGERAVEVEDDEALEAQAILVSREIASIDRALDRIAHGTYGTCLKCGGPISQGRLAARPEASLCIDCVASR